MMELVPIVVGMATTLGAGALAWWLWYDQRRVHVVGVNPNTGRMVIKRVRPRRERLVFKDDGGEDTQVPLVKSWGYDGPRGRAYLADVTTGQLVQVEALSEDEWKEVRVPPRLGLQIAKNDMVEKLVAWASGRLEGLIKMAPYLMIIASITALGVVYLLVQAVRGVQG